MKTKKIATMGFLCCISLLLIGATIVQAKPHKSKPSIYEMGAAELIGLEFIDPGKQWTSDGIEHIRGRVVINIFNSSQFYMNKTIYFNQNRNVETGLGHAWGKIILEITLYNEEKSGTFRGIFNMQLLPPPDFYHNTNLAIGTEGDFVGMVFRATYTPSEINQVIFDPHGRI